MGNIPELERMLEEHRVYAQRNGRRLAQSKPTKAARRLPELGQQVVTDGLEAISGARALGTAEGILSHLSASDRCRICGRDLTDPLSVRRGIGPDCIAKLRREAEEEARFREAMAALGHEIELDAQPEEEGVVEVTAEEVLEEPLAGLRAMREGARRAGIHV